MVGIEAENGSDVWFHQTFGEGEMTGSGQLQVGPGRFSNVPNGPGKTFQVTSRKVPAAQAQNALNKAKSMVGENTYNPVTNSCVSCGKQVLKAGGLKPPATTITPRALQRFMRK